MGDNLINVKYRDGRKNFKLYKGAEKVFYNIDSIVGYEYCILVEGEMDVLALHEAGISNVISVPNGATLNTNNLDYLDACIDYFEDKEKIILATDSDEAGVALQTELIRRLGSEVCFLATFDDCKDANEYLIKHGPEKLVSRITNAKPVPLENVTTFRDIEDEITDFVRNGFKPGFQVGLSNFDDIFSTYTGQFITVTGIPSSGKSDFVDRMVVGYNRNYEWKTAFASPENQPTYLHAHKLMRKCWGGMPTAADIYSDRWNQIADHCNTNFFHIDMERYTLEAVLKKGAELVKRKGIKCLVIDPFNKVRSNDQSGDVNVYTLEYLQTCLLLLLLTLLRCIKMQTARLKNQLCTILKAAASGTMLLTTAYLFTETMKQRLLSAKCLRLSFKTSARMVQRHISNGNQTLVTICL
jgi:twinkle protein